MPMKSFHQLLEKQTKKVIGLMSGTSVDGVDVVLVDIHGHGLATQIELLAFESFPFAAETRARIFELFNPETSRVDEICKMNFLMGEIFGNAVLALIEGVQLSIDEIDLIGSHGQTIYHLPPETGRSHVPSTLQIGEPAVIAHRTGTLTIADFRVADVAAGGHGGAAGSRMLTFCCSDRRNGQLRYRILEESLMLRSSPPGQMPAMSSLRIPDRGT